MHLGNAACHIRRKRTKFCFAHRETRDYGPQDRQRGDLAIYWRRLKGLLPQEIFRPPWDASSSSPGVGWPEELWGVKLGHTVAGILATGRLMSHLAAARWASTTPRRLSLRAQRQGAKTLRLRKVSLRTAPVTIDARP
jgi:hypothetical protein